MQENQQGATSETSQQQGQAAPAIQTAAAPAADNNQPLTEQGQMIANVIQMAQTNPEFAKKPEVQDMLSKLEQHRKGVTEKTPEQKQQTPAATTENEGSEGEQEGSDSVFFAKPKVVEVKDFDSFTGIVKSKFGMEDVNKFFPSVEKWRADSQELKGASDKIDMFENIFRDMPEPIYNSLDLFLKGQDWTEALASAPRINFNKPFENQVEKVTRHYFGDKVKTADFSEPDENTKIFIDLAKEKYNIGKQQYDSRRTEIQNRADSQAESLKKSALSSVDNLTQTFPDFNSSQIGTIRQMLVGDKIGSLFYNKDGTFKPDAAEKLALVLYGKEEISRKVKQKTTEAHNEKTMGEVDSQGRVKPLTTGQTGEAKLPENLEKMFSGLKEKPIY